MKDMKNAKSFFEEYKQYFTNKDFMHKLFDQSVKSMQKVQYERREQYEKFIGVIFSAANDLDLIKYVSEIPELKPLGNSFNNRFVDALIRKDDQMCKEYLKVFAAWSKTTVNYLYSNFKENYCEILERFADDPSLQDCLSSLVIIKERRRKDYYENYALYSPSYYSYNRDAKLILSDTLNSCLKNPKLLNYFKVFGHSNPEYFGMEYADICEKLSTAGYNSASELYSMIVCTEDFYSFLKEDVEYSDDKEFLKIVYNRFIKTFENENNSQALTTNIMSFNSNEVTKYFETYTNKNSTERPLVSTEFLKLIDIVSEIAEIIYIKLKKPEKYEVFKANIENCKDTLNIVCSM